MDKKLYGDWDYRQNGRGEPHSVVEEAKELDDMMIYLLTAIGLTPGGSSTVHIYRQTVHRTTQ